MNVYTRTNQALDDLIDAIAAGLKNADIDIKREVLDSLVSELDYLDSADTFGTEGWEHSFGVED